MPVSLEATLPASHTKNCFFFRSKWQIFLSFKVSSPAPEFTASYSDPGSDVFEVMRQGRKVQHSNPSKPQLKIRGNMSQLPSYSRMSWCLIKHKDFFFFLI